MLTYIYKQQNVSQSRVMYLSTRRTYLSPLASLPERALFCVAGAGAVGFSLGATSWRVLLPATQHQPLLETSSAAYRTLPGYRTLLGIMDSLLDSTDRR